MSVTNLVIELGDTIAIGKNYKRATYTLTAKIEEGDNLETVRRNLSNRIKEWIAEDLGISETPTRPTPPAPTGNVCSDCGKPVKGTFKRCFTCHQKSRNY